MRSFLPWNWKKEKERESQDRVREILKRIEERRGQGQTVQLKPIKRDVAKMYGVSIRTVERDLARYERQQTTLTDT